VEEEWEEELWEGGLGAGQQLDCKKKKIKVIKNILNSKFKK